MNKNILTVIGIVLAVVGAVVGSFIGFEAGQLTAFAVTMFGAGLAVANMWKGCKEGTKTWLAVLSMALIGVGAFIAGITGIVSETQLTSVIGYAISIALVIGGIITSIVQKKLN